jgi:fumarate reductase flavoprotein subunit
MEDNKCTGFFAENEDGEFEVQAKAVILATGGTGKHADFVKQETGWELGKDITVFPGMLYETKEEAPKLGVELGWEVGAFHTKLMIDSFASIPDPNFGPGGVPAQLPWFRQPQNICVNYHGERFIDEAEMRNGAFMGNAISVQKKSTGFMIFTQKMREKYENEGMDYSIGNIHFMDNLTADEYLEMNQKRGNKDIMCFDTLEELCEGMGISDKLIETVKEYNQNIKE